MIARCGLNRLMQFAGYFGRQLRNAKTDPMLLQALVQLDEVQHSGLALGPEEEAWALQNGISIRVNLVSVIILQLLLTIHFPPTSGLYRMSLEAANRLLCCSRSVERDRIGLC